MLFRKRKSYNSYPWSRRVLVLDPDLGPSVGHHWRYSTALRESFTRLGHQVAVYAALKCRRADAASIGAQRVFKSSLYSNFQLNASVSTRWISSSAMLARELSIALPRLDSEDLIVVHTTGRDHLLGFYVWYIGLPTPRPRLCLQIMFPPAFRASEAEQEIAVELMKRSVDPWLELSSDRVLLAVDNRQLAAHLNELLNYNFFILPMPVWTGPAPAKARRTEGAPVLFIPGELRREKGKKIIEDAAFQLRNEPFSILVQSSSRTKLDIRKITNSSSQICAVPTGIEYRRYLQVIVDADAVLLPYDPTEYAWRSSGAFVEALGCGKPVLVSAGTTMANELERIGPVGVVMSQYTAEGFGDAVRQLSGQLTVLTKESERIAPAFRAKHSASAFAELLVRWMDDGRLDNSTRPEALPSR